MEKLEDAGNLYRDPQMVNEWMKVLLGVSNLAIRERAIFGSQYEGVAGSQVKVLGLRPSVELSRSKI